MEQEKIDEQMLKGGVVPVSDHVHMLPTAANGAREFRLFREGWNISGSVLTFVEIVKGKGTKVQPEEEDEEAELAKLQAEMAM